MTTPRLVLTDEARREEAKIAALELIASRLWWVAFWVFLIVVALSHK